MKLLSEVKTLDVRLYEEQQKHTKKSKQGHPSSKSVKIKEIGDRGTSGSPDRNPSDEPSGSSYSQFIRRSTEEIENIIRRIQFESDKKKSAEKPPQPPRVHKS